MCVVNLGYFGPSITQSFSKKVLNRVYLKIVSLFLKFRITLPVSLFFPKMRNYLSNLEILMILPSEAIREKSNPSWWLRAVVSKNK